MAPIESHDPHLVAPIFDSISPEPLSLKESPGSKPPQFETAEYANQSNAEKCGQCDQPFTDRYYKLNGRRLCPTCTELVKSSQLKTEGNYFRGLLFGIGAAILGLILYAGFEIATGWTIGYLSLAVGFIIAKAIMKGSGGTGGRKLQVAAVLLTYGAVSLAAIPVTIHYYSSKKNSENSQIANPPQAKAGGEFQSTDAQTVVVSEPPDNAQPPGLLSAIGVLFMIGLASPFLGLADGFNGIIGLVILFVGIQIAWKMTQAPVLQILGPFQVNAKASQ